jgi:hypothetical protein
MLKLGGKDKHTIAFFLKFILKFQEWGKGDKAE